MKYNTPELEVLQLEVADIITSSPFGEGDNATTDDESTVSTRPNWG